MSRRARRALKRRKPPYRDHLLDLFFTAGVEGQDLPGIRTADLRRIAKRDKRARVKS